jgi:zinc finger-like protein
LFDQLAQLLTEALAQQGAQQAATVQAFSCKVEEIHTTLRKHLAKEEEQLLPLLLCHFTHAQQVSLLEALFALDLSFLVKVYDYIHLVGTPL